MKVNEAIFTILCVDVMCIRLRKASMYRKVWVVIWVIVVFLLILSGVECEVVDVVERIKLKYGVFCKFGVWSGFLRG